MAAAWEILRGDVALPGVVLAGDPLQGSPFAGQEYQAVSNYCRIDLRMISETETGLQCIRRGFRRFHVLWVKWQVW